MRGWSHEKVSEVFPMLSRRRPIMTVDYAIFEKADVDDALRALVASLLGKQGKVLGNLSEKADRCRLICIARVDEHAIGMGAIKEATQRDFDADTSGLGALRSAFAWELGYFYTGPLHEGHGIGSHIAELLLERYGSHNIMASTEVSPPSGMVRILERNGFQRKGKRWPSAIHGNQLGLFLRYA